MSVAFRLIGPIEDGTVISSVECLIPGERFPVKDMQCCYCGVDVIVNDKEGVGIIIDSKAEIANIAHMKCLKKDPEWVKTA